MQFDPDAVAEVMAEVAATEIMPPSTSNTRPVTSRESALPSQTTSGEMFAGSLTSKPASGAFMRSANTSSVMRVRADGAIALSAATGHGVDDFKSRVWAMLDAAARAEQPDGVEPAP